MNKYQRELKKYEGKEPTFVTDEGTKYYGSVLNGKANGKGTQITKDGVINIGNWINGHMNGKGIHYYKDGSYFIGSFTNGGRYHGKGAEHTADGKVIRRGVWDNGRFVEKSLNRVSSKGNTKKNPLSVIMMIITLGLVVVLILVITKSCSDIKKIWNARVETPLSSAVTTSPEPIIDVIFDVTRFADCDTEKLKSILGEPTSLDADDDVGITDFAVPGEWWTYSSIDGCNDITFLVIQGKVINCFSFTEFQLESGVDMFLPLGIGVDSSTVSTKSKGSSTTEYYAFTTLGIDEVMFGAIDNSTKTVGFFKVTYDMFYTEEWYRPVDDLSRIQYCNATKEFVLATLKSPSTAKFPAITTILSTSDWGVAGNKYYVGVSSYVDAQNSFGATIREWFHFIYDAGTYNLRYAVYDGKVIYNDNYVSYEKLLKKELGMK